LRNFLGLARRSVDQNESLDHDLTSLSRAFGVLSRIDYRPGAIGGIKLPLAS
jgi:hypothetical protein